MRERRTKTVFDALGRHAVHPFPARMAPSIALAALSGSTRPLRVLDPMSGSGTVLAVAQAKGHIAVGTDIDPLAALLAKVWTTEVKTDRVEKTAAAVLKRSKQLYKKLRADNAYPNGADAETRAFIQYWFDAYARRQLTALSISIRQVKDRDIRDTLWVALSRLIITKSAGASRAMDLSHSRPHRAYTRAPVKPFDKFLTAAKTVAENSPRANVGETLPATKVSVGDARFLKIPNASIDLVITSPPYLNAIDYMRCSKFSLVWMGFSIEKLRRIRRKSVGSEAIRKGILDSTIINEIIRALKLRPALSPHHTYILAQYIQDMYRAIAETARVLNRNGEAVYVVGETTVRGTYIRNSAIVSQVASHVGLKLVKRRSRALPANRRYLPPPNATRSANALDARMRREVVLVFTNDPPRKGRKN